MINLEFKSVISIGIAVNPPTSYCKYDLQCIVCILGVDSYELLDLISLARLALMVSGKVFIRGSDDSAEI